MFERFTERSRQVVTLATEEARVRRHSHVEPLHILKGLTREEEGLGARILSNFDIDAADVNDVFEWAMPHGTTTHTGTIPFSVDGKRVLELALREALSLGHNYIGTEHILLGLLRSQKLNDLFRDGWGEKPESIRQEALRRLNGPKPKEAPVKEEEVQEEEPLDKLARWLRKAADIVEVVGEELR